jgi:3-deoxy-D-manno-octulosonic-acid transferase
VRAANADSLLAQAVRLLCDVDERTQMGQRAAQFASRHRGATLRTVELLQQEFE